MLILDAKKFLVAIHILLDLEIRFRDASAPLHPKLKEHLDTMSADLQVHFEELALPVTKKMCDNMIHSAKETGHVAEAIRHVYNTMAMEIDGRKFYAPTNDLEKYFQKNHLFGKEVFDNFPSAANDIFEAGTCLAFDRNIACVMHSMRVAEVGLTSLASTVGIAKRNDWGSYLRDIDSELNRRIKSAGARTADEQFYAEAHIVLDGMRRAWRNPTMHVENTYSAERAKEIMRAVRSFMRHLATRISERSA